LSLFKLISSEASNDFFSTSCLLVFCYDMLFKRTFLLVEINEYRQLPDGATVLVIVGVLCVSVGVI